MEGALCKYWTCYGHGWIDNSSYTLAASKIHSTQTRTGPSKEEQLSGEYELLFTGTTSDGTKVKCRITGDQDPGYGSTAKMLAQSAICLAKDVPKNTKGGFWTPATIMGDKLTKRLITQAGLDFEIIDS